MKVNPSTGLPLQIAYFIAHSSIKLLFGSPSSSQIEQRASQISWLWSAAHSTMWGGKRSVFSPGARPLRRANARLSAAASRYARKDSNASTGERKPPTPERLQVFGVGLLEDAHALEEPHRLTQHRFGIEIAVQGQAGAHHADQPPAARGAAD